MKIIVEKELLTIIYDLNEYILLKCKSNAQ